MTFMTWLRTVRIRSLLLVLVPSLLALPLCLTWLLEAGEESGSRGGINAADTARKVLGLIEFDHLSGPEIKARIDELLRIKGSVQEELRRLEQRRSLLQAELGELSRRIEQAKMESSRESKELERLRVSVEQVKLAQAEYIQRNTPDIAAPLPLLATAAHLLRSPHPSSSSSCSFSSCFDFSRCSVSSQMPTYLSPSLSSSLSSALLATGHVTREASTACLYVTDLNSHLSSLPHWAGDGRNHLLLHLQGPPVDTRHTGRAMLVSSFATSFSWRRGFDLVLPSVPEWEGPVLGREQWEDFPALVPVVRPLLLVFEGQQQEKEEVQDSGLEDSLRQDREVVSVLKDMTVSGTNDKFHFTFACSSHDPSQTTPSATDWWMCGSHASRVSLLSRATFCLVLPPSNHSLLSTPQLQTRLRECLLAASVPVIMSTDLLLPFSEVVDWSRAAVILPLQRVTELHFLLRTLPHSDIFSMKRQGRLILTTYLASVHTVAASLLGVLRQRLTIPALPWPDTPSPSVFNASFSPALMEHLPLEVEPDESLGPLEPAFPSPAFKRNYSMVLSHSSHSWNTIFSPHRAAPFTPWEPLLPSEAKFLGSGLGFRPIAGGEGGAGAEFSHALGGNSPQEQFTVVMLTYERDQVLVNSLARLYGLPYLNKVVVVWNSPQPPSETLQWPDIGVPIVVVRTETNSLNNRFLPYSEIETEAVLSVDDDAHLRHDEIIFGFRVWRENRERLVGFPGRFHAWDVNHSSWNYNSNYSCELSMVLTGRHSQLSITAK